MKNDDLYDHSSWNWCLLAGTPVEFVGNPVDTQENPVDLRDFFGFAASLLTQLKFDQDKIRSEYVERRIIPKTILNLSSFIPNATANTQGAGYLTINLGIILSFTYLSSITKLLNMFLSRDSVDMKDIEAYEPDASVLHEVNQMMQCWYTSHINGWRVFVPPPKLRAE